MVTLAVAVVDSNQTEPCDLGRLQPLAHRDSRFTGMEKRIAKSGFVVENRRSHGGEILSQDKGSGAQFPQKASRTFHSVFVVGVPAQDVKGPLQVADPLPRRSIVNHQA